MMNFLSYWFWQFVIQSVLHSFVIAIIVESLLRFWKTKQPAVRLRFLLLILWVPLACFPFFQFLNPARGNYDFRNSTALFDMNSWLFLRIIGGIYLGHAFLVMLMLFSLLFFFQEFVPILSKLNKHSCMDSLPGEFPNLDAALDRMSKIGKPIPVVLIQSQVPILYSSGFPRVKVHISTSFLKVLDEEELEGVLAHEMAHIQFKDQVIGWILFFFRLLAFFNPIALLEFRRIIHEREILCDQQAVRFTRKPLALASGLSKFFRMQEQDLHEKQNYASFLNHLRLHSLRIVIENRVTGLVHPRQDGDLPFFHFRMAVTVFAIVLLLFYIV